MRDPKKPSDWTEDEIKNKIISTVLLFWFLGCCVIFVMGCVTYYYVGAALGMEGQVGFQVTGLLVGGIIAHYSFRMFRFMSSVREAEEDEDED